MTVRLQKTVWPLGGLGILPSSQMSCSHPPSNPWFLCLEKGRKVIAPVTRAPGRGLAEGARDLGTELLRVPSQPEHWKPVFPQRLQEAQPIPLPCVRVCECVPVLGCEYAYVLGLAWLHWLWSLVLCCCFSAPSNKRDQMVLHIRTISKS